MRSLPLCETMNALKIVRRRPAPSTPEEFHRAGAQMDREIDRVTPQARRRGFVFKARTWDDLALWEARRMIDPPRNG